MKKIKKVVRWSNEYAMEYEEWINDHHPHLSTNNGENLDREEEFEEAWIDMIEYEYYEIEFID